MTRLFCFSGVVFTAVLVLGTAVYGGEPKEPAQKLTDADSGKTVKVKVGDSVTISLKGNPTTGYSWRTAKLDGQSIEQSGDPKYTVDAHQSGMVGVGGKFVFSFKATKSGKTQISLEYVRPWEKGKKPVQTFAVTIEVEVEDRAK